MSRKTTAPIPIEHIDVSKITLQKPKKESDNKYGKMLYIKYNDGDFCFVLPEMNVPWGGRKPTKDFDKVTINVSFAGMDEDSPRGERLRKAHKKLSEIDERLFQLVRENLQLLFPKENKKALDELAKKPDLLRARCKSIINTYTDPEGKEYPDRFNLTVQRHRLTDQEEKDLSLDEKERLRRTLISAPRKPLLVDKKGKQVDVDADNIDTVIPPNSVLKAVVRASYMFVKTSSPYTCSFAWSFIHGILVSANDAPAWDITLDEGNDEKDSDSESEKEGVEVEDSDDDDEEDEEDAQLAAAAK